MGHETAEWIEKAEGDFRTAEREKNSAEYPNYDADLEDADEAMRTAKHVRQIVRAALKLEK
jgi:HEPN domain-containing protein